MGAVRALPIQRGRLSCEFRNARCGFAVAPCGLGAGPILCSEGRYSGMGRRHARKVLPLTELSAGVVYHRPHDVTTNTTPGEDRTIVHCRKCAADYLITETRIESTHRSAEGLIGYLRCVAGHLSIHQFAEAYPKPAPPPSVIARRSRLVAAERLAADWITGSC